MNEKMYDEYLITIYKEISFAETFNQNNKTYEEVSYNIKKKFELMSSLFNNGLAKEYIETINNTYSEEEDGIFSFQRVPNMYWETKESNHLFKKIVQQKKEQLLNTIANNLSLRKNKDKDEEAIKSDNEYYFTQLKFPIKSRLNHVFYGFVIAGINKKENIEVIKDFFIEINQHLVSYSGDINYVVNLIEEKLSDSNQNLFSFENNNENYIHEARYYNSEKSGNLLNLKANHIEHVLLEILEDFKKEKTKKPKI